MKVGESVTENRRGTIGHQSVCPQNNEGSKQNWNSKPSTESIIKFRVLPEYAKALTTTEF